MSNASISPAEASAATGDTFRITPAYVPAPEGSFVYCLGSDTPGTEARLDDSDRYAVSQTATFEDAKVVKWRARWRGARYVRKFVQVTTASTQTYTFTLTDWQGNVYQVDHAVDTVNGQTLASGTLASILNKQQIDTTPGPATPFDVYQLVGISGALIDSDDSGIDSYNHIRHTVDISGADADNNGTWSVWRVLADDEVMVRPLITAVGLVNDPNNGAISWSLKRIQQGIDVDLIAVALAARLNETAAPIFAEYVGEGVFAITSTDPDESFDLSVGTNLEQLIPVWTFRTNAVGEVWGEQEVIPTKERDRFNGGANLAPGGTQTLSFDLQLTFVDQTGASNLPPTALPVEIPALYLDAIAFDLSSVPFTPASITGLQAWWRADLVDASPVAVMFDKSGNGRNTSQPTAGDRPDLVSSDLDFGGQPVVLFDKTNTEYLIADALAFIHDNEDESSGVFIVFADDDGGESQALVSWSNDTNANEPLTALATAGPGNEVVAAKVDNAGVGVTRLSPNAPLIGVPRIMVWSLSGAASCLVTDDEGVEVVTSAIDVGDIDAIQFAIGASQDNGGVQGFLSGRIAEIAIYGNAVGGAATANVINLINYARVRYGFIGDLLEIPP